MKIPHVSGNAVYDLNGKLFKLIPLYGKGKASVQLVDLAATGSAALTITADGHLQVCVCVGVLGVGEMHFSQQIKLQVKEMS